MNAAYSKQYASRVRYKEVCQQCRYIEAYFQCILQCSIYSCKCAAEIGQIRSMKTVWMQYDISIRCIPAYDAIP